MQTFLTHASFAQSAKVLDDARCGKQRVEAIQIYDALVLGPTSSPNPSAVSARLQHPAVRMWKGYEDLLGLYHNFVVAEWESRGFENNMLLVDVPEAVSRDYVLWLNDFIPRPACVPHWLGDRRIHNSYRAALMKKTMQRMCYYCGEPAPAHYARYGWHVKPAIAYVWPA